MARWHSGGATEEVVDMLSVHRSLFTIVVQVPMRQSDGNWARVGKGGGYTPCCGRATDVDGGVDVKAETCLLTVGSLHR